MKAYRMYFGVTTGDGKLVGIFSNRVNAQTFVDNSPPIFTSELRITEIYTDLLTQKEWLNWGKFVLS